MTDSNPITEGASSAQSSSAQPSESHASDGSDRSSTSANLRVGRRLLIAFGLAAGLIVFLQTRASSTDHQNANLASFAIGALATLYVLVELHLMAARRARPMIVPAAAGAVLLTLIATVRFDGFSGEMWPQFKPRFAVEPAMRRVSDEPVTATPSEQDADHATASSPSLGFLGTSRTAVIPNREFEIPGSVSEVITLWDQGIGDGWSSFAVLGDRAVTLEQRDQIESVSCYRLADGELLWMISHEARHEHPLGGVGPRSTPTIDNTLVESGLVYAQGATGTLWCIDLASGDVLWNAELIQRVERDDWDRAASESMITWGRAGSPLLVDRTSAVADWGATDRDAEPSRPDAEPIRRDAEAGDSNGRPSPSNEKPQRLCVCPFGGPDSLQDSGRSLIAFDAATGETVWTAGEDQISYASPVLMTLGDVPQIVSVNERTVTGHAVNDGQVLWAFDWPGNSNADANCASPIQAGPNRVLVGKGYGGGSALIEVETGESGWIAEAVWESSRVLKTKFTHPCVDGDVAYAISNGSLEAVDIETGEQLWQQPRSSRYRQGQILLVDDVIVAQAETGELAVVAADPTEFRELARLPALDSKTWNVPTVAGRHLLVRNDRRAICFLLPSRDQ